MRARQELNPDVWKSARAAALALATPAASAAADIEFEEMAEAPHLVSELLWEGSHVPFVISKGASGHPLAPDPVWLEAMAEAVLTSGGGGGGGGGGGLSPSGAFLSPMASAACALGLWGHRPSDRWLAALGEEVRGTSFLLSEGEMLLLIEL